MLRKRQTNLQTISKYETAESKEFPMWIENLLSFKEVIDFGVMRLNSVGV